MHQHVMGWHAHLCFATSQPFKCAHVFPCSPQARALFRELPSLVDISIPDDKHFTVCGDVHGQFYDLLNIWELNGMPGPDNPYLFNGEPFITLLVGCYDLLLCHHIHVRFVGPDRVLCVPYRCVLQKQGCVVNISGFQGLYVYMLCVLQVTLLTVVRSV
jgi:hypothetical protein